MYLSSNLQSELTGMYTRPLAIQGVDPAFTGTTMRDQAPCSSTFTD